MIHSDPLAQQLAGLEEQPASPELVAQYIFAHLRARHGAKWYGSRVARAPAYSQEERQSLSALKIVQSYQLNSVGGDAREGLLGWLEGRYPLKLRLDEPTPDEMLELQCQGQRFITLRLAWEQQFLPYGRHKGALEFVLHDLEHAHKFFGHWFEGQRAFFRLVRDTHFPRFDREFQTELDYVRSDMNSHPFHMFKYLKAILLNAFIRAQRLNEFDSYCSTLFTQWRLPQASAMRVNYPGLELPSDAIAISDFFMSL